MKKSFLFAAWLLVTGGLTYGVFSTATSMDRHFGIRKLLARFMPESKSESASVKKADVDLPPGDPLSGALIAPPAPPPTLQSPPPLHQPVAGPIGAVGPVERPKSGGVRQSPEKPKAAVKPPLPVTPTTAKVSKAVTIADPPHPPVAPKPAIPEEVRNLREQGQELRTEVDILESKIRKHTRNMAPDIEEDLALARRSLKGIETSVLKEDASEKLKSARAYYCKVRDIDGWPCQEGLGQ